MIATLPDDAPRSDDTPLRDPALLSNPAPVPNDALLHNDALASTRDALSPRTNRQPASLVGIAIHAGALLLWCALILRAVVGGGGVFAWSAGIVYILYDALLLVFVFARTLPLGRAPATIGATLPLPAATVIVAAHNEAASLGVTIAALMAQTAPAAHIVIADDGSTDGTAAVLAELYGLAPPPLGTLGAPSPTHPTLRWLRLPHGGKARALNAACMLVTTELMVTVDADTLLDPPALAAMTRAFAADPDLVAATGVLTPLCGPSAQGRLLEWFQSYEYVRNFLSRYAWMRTDGLLLISGAFGCYRKRALLAVGGFDPDCLVEDYELTHRLRDHAGRTGTACHTAVIGAAHARTDAPGTLATFLRQRRRWFGGFLQTQLWYRHMVGNPRYGAHRHRDAAGQGDRHAAAALRARGHRADRGLCRGRPRVAARGGGDRNRRQARDRPGVRAVVDAALPALDRQPDRAQPGMVPARDPARAVLVPDPAPCGRGAGLGDVPDRRRALGRAGAPRHHGRRTALGGDPPAGGGSGWRRGRRSIGATDRGRSGAWRSFPRCFRR